jgi:hypothetical protein
VGLVSSRIARGAQQDDVGHVGHDEDVGHVGHDEPEALGTTRRTWPKYLKLDSCLAQVPPVGNPSQGHARIMRMWIK